MIKVQTAAAAAKYLDQGMVVALPTETVYGLAVKLNSVAGLEKLTFLKRREIGSGKVFTLVPPSRNAVTDYAILTSFAERLVKKYVPGELTLILHKNPAFRHPYFNHFKTVGVRIPQTPLFNELLALTGPLLLTSANSRGAEPALTSAEVEERMPKVDVVFEGRAGNRPPSTVLDCTVRPAQILRQGRLKFTFKEGK